MARIERPFREIDVRLTPGAKRFGNRITMSRSVGDNRQEQQIEMAFEYLRFHTS